MKRLVLLSFFLLSACGGGGGGSSNTLPPQPVIQTVNTASPYYLPLANGNSWTFSSGAKMVDLGSLPLQCTCPANGLAAERIALYPAGSSTISGSFFFMKNTPTGGTQITNMAGVENDANTNNITIASDTSFPYGIPVMDDSPRQNESWNDGAGDASTIIAVGGTLSLSSTTQVINVATSQLTGPSFSTITWAFAKGVGFTTIGVGSQSVNITTFSVDVTNSHSNGRRPASVTAFQGHTGQPDMGLLRALFR